MKNLYKHLTACFLVLTVSLFIQSNSFADIYPIIHTLTGAQENPPNASPGTGSINGTFNDVTKELTFNVVFSGLLAGTTAAHFHAAAGPLTNAPVRIGFVGFPTGVTSGTYANTYILTPQQEGWLLTDSMYVNVHSTLFPAGEIRAHLFPDAPLPVELASFVSTVNGNSVTLNWTTLSELNNSGFDIERKATVSSEWTRAGFVEGHGTINGTSNYTFSELVNTGSYNYRLKQIDFNGNYEYFNLSNEVKVGIPSVYSLTQNYPNPYNPTTNLEFAVPVDGNVSIVLYDMSGRKVSTLVNEMKTAGYYVVQFNGSNLSSGIYFYTITADNFVDTKRMALVK